MSETMVRNSLSTYRAKSLNYIEPQPARWRFGVINGDQLELIGNLVGDDDDESAAVGLREMTLSEDATQQLQRILDRPQRPSSVAPRQVPLA